MSHISERLERIRSLKKELLLRFTMLSHLHRKPGPELELMIDVRRLEQELQAVRQEMHRCETDSIQEEACLKRIRTLEDQRFQLLSRLNGNHINAYISI